MANKELGELTDAGALSSADLFYIVDSAGNSRKLPLSDLKTFINTDPTVVPSSEPWLGIQLERTSNLSVATSSATAIPWSAVVEDTSDGSLSWSAGNPTRVTIGAGVTRIMAIAQIRWASNATGSRTMWINKNGSSSFKGWPRGIVPAISAEEISSPVIGEMSVVETDYVDLNVFQNSGGALNVLTHNATWFKVFVTERQI